VQKGDELTLRVVKVDVKNRRLGLSLKRVSSAEYLDMDMARAYSQTPEERQSFTQKVSETLKTVAKEIREEVEEAVEDVREAVEDVVEKVQDVLDGDDTKAED
jgi:translation initiation factor 2 alpha subunit (eIF-2alpha)